MVDNIALNIAIWIQVVIAARIRVPRESDAPSTSIQTNTVRVRKRGGGEVDNVSVEDEVSDILSEVDAAARETTVA